MIAQRGIEARVDLVGRVSAMDKAAFTAAPKAENQIPGHGIERILAELIAQGLQPAVQEMLLTIDQRLDRIGLVLFQLAALRLELLHLLPHPP